MNTKSTSNYSAELLALKNLRALEGIKRIGGKEESYRKQLHRFRANYPNAANELQHILAQQGCAAAGSYCHNLKGVAGNIGAHLLCEILTSMDNQLKQAQIPSADDFEQLQNKLTQLMDDIDSLNENSLDPVSSQALSNVEIIDKITQLKLVLTMDLGKSETLITQLRAHVLHSQIETDINEIAKQIDVFNLDDAQILLTNLQQKLCNVL